MDKAKTLRECTISSENTPKLRLKKKAKITKHDPSIDLLDEDLIALALWECLKKGDPKGAVEVINAHLYALYPK